MRTDDLTPEQREQLAEVNAASRTMFRVILRQLLLMFAVVAILGLPIGYLVAGSRGIGGVALALGLTALFILTTVAVMYLTVEQHVFVSSAAAMGSWLVKMGLVFVVMLLVRGMDFYDPAMFLVTLAVVIIASTVIEMRGVLKARIPYVTPGFRRPRKP